MMKKIVSLLLVVMLLACTAATAFASEEGVSTFIGGFDTSVDELLSTSRNRAMATWLGILDYMIVFGKDLDTIDLSKDSYAGKYGASGALDVFLPMSGRDGYFNLTWYPNSNKIYLYTFYYTPAELLQNYPNVTKNDTSDMIEVGQIIVDAIGQN